MNLRFAIGLGALALCCCNGAPAAPSEQSTALAEGEVARVGGLPITAEAVRHIAAAQRVSAQEARSRAVFDALMAEGARQRGYDRDPFVIVEQRGVLADALLMRVKREADRTPSTAEELERVTSIHWLDLDRPQARRTVHAVAMAADSDAEARKKARSVAEKIAEAVKGKQGAGAFIDAAKAVAADGIEVRTEQLQPVTEDGRIADLVNRPEPGAPTPRFEMDYVTAVWKQLHAPGDQTGPVASPFGWHVIMLTEIQPAQIVPEAQRSRMLRDEIVATRAKVELDKLLLDLRARIPVKVERNAEGHLGTIATPSLEDPPR